jgi:hypothetical protein
LYIFFYEIKYIRKEVIVMSIEKKYEKWCAWIEMTNEKPELILECFQVDKYKLYMDSMIEYHEKLKEKEVV